MLYTKITLSRAGSLAFWGQERKNIEDKTIFDIQQILEITASCILRKLAGLPPKLVILLAGQVQSCRRTVQVGFHWISFTE